ncbi:TolC family protein [Larkinella soli]|uniref:TolC family protein n=1 Tax=Larkinella soli TaxID=1770527 RepID=UPI001E3C08D0|nr:TolC family protein [Larkinella soli]
MKTYTTLSRLALFFLFITLVRQSFAQGNGPAQPAPVVQGLAVSDSVYFDFNRDISVQLLPFEELYQLAVKNSPQVKFEKEMTVGYNASYKLSRMQVLQNGVAFVNYSTGNQAIISTGAGSGDVLGQISNGYRTGVQLSISLHDIFGRPQQIRLARANQQAALYRREAFELQLKRELIGLYQDLLTAQRVLHVRLEDEQASLAAFRIAEVEIQKGKVTPEAHAYNMNRYAQTKSTAEQAKGEFLKNLYNLEAVVGVPIQQLKRK